MSGRLRATASFAASLAFIGLLAITACSSPAMVTAASTGRTFAQRDTDVPGIPNYAVIAEGIARGGQPDPAGLGYLKEHGFRTIINFRQHHSERKQAEALGMTVVELPLQADMLGSEAPTDEQVRKFLEVINDPAQRPVFFHCAHGKDRTGTMAALYRIEIDGWTNDEAIEEMKAFGYHTIYQDLIDYVRNYRPRGFKQKP